MKIVHRGFDTITLSIQARLTPELFEYLTAEKEKAEAQRAPVEINYNGVKLHLEGHGGKGYRFIAKGGPLGANWFFKKPQRADPWGVRLTVGSTMLATQGLGAARAHINDTMDRLGLSFSPHGVSIARADFCVDILAPQFVLRPENFVMHSNAGRADHWTGGEDIKSRGVSGRYTSVTVGATNGRQAVIYDKRAEIISKKKPIWWEIWNRNLAAAGEGPLDASDTAASRVWRIEIRAGKGLLKDRWKTRTWADFDDRFANIIAEAMEKIRYTNPDPKDTNRARWPDAEIWRIAKAEAAGDLAEMWSPLERQKVKEVYREAQIRIMQQQVKGSAITLAALQGADEEALRLHMTATGRQMAEEVREEPERAAQKLKDAKERYTFI